MIKQYRVGSTCSDLTALEMLTTHKARHQRGRVGTHKARHQRVGEALTGVGRQRDLPGGQRVGGDGRRVGETLHVPGQLQRDGVIAHQVLDQARLRDGSQGSGSLSGVGIHQVLDQARLRDGSQGSGSLSGVRS